MSVRRILLVDDEPKVLIALRRALAWDGYQIFTAVDASQALELMMADPVDIVLSDNVMPGQNGIDLFEQMKARWPDTVRVMLTGYSDHELALKALERGAIFRYLTKPWDDVDLRITLRQAVAYREQMVESKHLLDFMDRRHSRQLDALVDLVPDRFAHGKA